jgi:hypothetical protein
MSSSPRTPWMNLAQSTPTPPYANKRPIVRALLIAGELPPPLTISLLSICNFIAHPWNPLGSHHHWWPRASKLQCMSNLSLGMTYIHS